MRITKTILLSSALFILSFSFAYAGSIDLDVEIEDIYEVGDTIDISWDSEGIDSDKTLAIYLQSTEEGFLYPIETELSLYGSYEWTIPSSTADAEDYTLSLSTEDKGPSVFSSYSEEFEIAGGKAAYKITDYSVEVESSDEGEGEITVYYETNRTLTSSHYLNMNINCPEDVEIESDSVDNLECKSWTSLDEEDEEFSLSYKLDSDEDQWISFTIDLYEDNGLLLQRVFLVQIELPAEMEESMDDEDLRGNGLFSDLSSDQKIDLLEFIFADDPDLLRLLELLIILGIL